MSTLRNTVLLALTLGMCSACTPRPTDLTSADRAAIQHVIDQVAHTLVEGDLQAWAGQFSEDGVIYSPNSPAVKGRATIQKWAQGIARIQELSFSDVQIWGQGDYAYATSAYRFAVTGAATDIGKQLWAFRRTAAKNWEVLVASYSSDLPAVAAAPSDSARKALP